ncbi:hypothetical protein [Sutcliffiella sp. BMC8]
MIDYKVLNIEPYINNRGFTSISTVKEGNLTLGNSSFPLEKFLHNNTYFHKDVPFHFYSNSKGDNIELMGQRIELPSIIRADSLHIIGNSSNGSFSDNILFILNNNIILKKKINLTCLLETNSLFQNYIFKKFDYLHNMNGICYDESGTLWYEIVEFDRTLQFNEILLPDNPFMHIFSMTYGYSKDYNN